MPTAAVEDVCSTALHMRRLHVGLDAFYARGYLSTWCESVRGAWADFLHGVFAREVDSAAVDPVVVDVGCGPSVANVISASAWSSHIHMADLLSSNREEIERFRRGDDDAFQWTHYFEHIAKLEGDVAGSAELASRTRSAIRRVLSCDVCDPSDMRKCLPPADVVIASLVLDVVASTHDEFVSALANVCVCAKPQGLVVVQGSLGETAYTVASAAFPAMNIDEEALMRAFAQCKLQLLKWTVTKRDSTHYFALLRYVP